MSIDHVFCRPHVQGSTLPLRLRASVEGLTDGAWLLLFRRLLDRLAVPEWLDRRLVRLPGLFRPSLMLEVWTAVLWYGAGWLDDLALLRQRRIRRLFGWVRIPDPTIFGRWFRRGGAEVVGVLDALTRWLVRIRWAWNRVWKVVTVPLDSTVAVRYGEKQAGAEVGYNPKKPGRPSHHPLLAFLQETGDLLGIRWLPCSGWVGAGAESQLSELVPCLREAKMEGITVRLYKGFFSERIVLTLQELVVSYLLKVPNHRLVREQLGRWRRSRRVEGIFPKTEQVQTLSGRLWGDRLLSLEGRRVAALEEEGGLAIETVEITEVAHLLTSLPGLHALTARGRYNAGSVVDQRIAELGQLSVGQTAINDRRRNFLLWALGGLAYRLFLRRELPGRWRTAQPKRLRIQLFRLAGRFTTSGGQGRLDVPAQALQDGLLHGAFRAIHQLRAPPLHCAH